MSEVVLTRVGNGSKSGYGLYRCVCGKEKEIKDGDVKRGHTKSCGCLKLKSGGLCRRGKVSKAYVSWSGAMRRCYDEKHKDYKHYGKRGIRICQRWRESVEAFCADMGEPPIGQSIDRIKNGGGYWCGKSECSECGPFGRELNCKWSTVTEQRINRRITRFITYNGEKLCLTAWARKFKTTAGNLYERIENNGVQKTFNRYLPFDGTPVIDHLRENANARDGCSETST